jgi:branched-chain amino acid transport system substrate-binding protein
MALSVFITCCGAAKTAEAYNGPAAETVSIGVAYPVSQWDAKSDYRQGLELAVWEINQAGGVLGKPLSLVIRDDKDDARTAMQIAETFHDLGITAVVGHWSSDVCYYVEDIYEERGMIMITPYANSRALFELEYQYIFRAIADNTDYALTLADHAQERGFRRMAIYYVENTYGSDNALAMEQELSKRKIAVIDRITSVSPVNIAGVIRRWRAFGCDGIIISAAFTEGAEVVKCIRDAGSDDPIFLTNGFDHRAFGEIMAGYTDNLYAIVYGTEDMDEAFLGRYREVWGHDPAIYEVTGYQAVWLLAEAINACGTLDSAALSTWLKELRDYPVVMGAFSYNPQTQGFSGQRLRVKPWTP